MNQAVSETHSEKGLARVAQSLPRVAQSLARVAQSLAKWTKKWFPDA